MADVYYRKDGSTIYYRNGWASGYTIRPNWDPMDVNTQVSSSKNVIIELVDDKFILPYNSSYLVAGAVNSTFNDMDKWDTSEVRDMTGMFFRCVNATELNLSNFNTSNVTDMRGMFTFCGVKDLDLSTFDTSNVTDMSHMFRSFSGTQLNLLNFNVDKVKNVNSMFSNCQNLTEIMVEKNSDWSINTLNRTGDEMFYNCKNLPNWDGTTDLSRANNTTENGYFGSGRPWAKYTLYYKTRDFWYVMNPYIKAYDEWDKVEVHA